MKQTIHLLTFFILSLCFWSVGAQVANPVWEENFENISTGNKWYGKAALVVTADGGVGDSKCVRVEYDVRKDPSGSTVQQFSQAIKPALEYTLQYDMFFESNWTSTMGGKFHGLTPKTHVTGCNPVTPEKWSARITLVDRTPSLYLYDQNKNSECGRQIKQSNLKMEKEKWYSVCLYVKVNSTATSSDGVAEIYVNGKLESKMENVQFRAEDGERTLIQNFLFSTFLGGGRNGTLVSRQYIRYDNFAVVPGKSIRVSPSNPATGNIGIKQNNFSKLKVFPNPTSGIVMLSEYDKWELYNLSMAKLRAGEGNRIDLADMSKGIYIIKTNLGTQRIIYF
jgi:hypothetical protein